MPVFTQAERCAMLIEEYLSCAPSLDADGEQRVTTALVALVGLEQASRIVARTQGRLVEDSEARHAITEHLYSGATTLSTLPGVYEFFEKQLLTFHAQHESVFAAAE